MKKSLYFDKLLVSLSLFYFILPILLFFFGWLNLITAVIFSLILIFGGYLCLKSHTYQPINFEPKQLIGFISINFILFLWIYFSGIGGFQYQNWDFHGRNALLHDLINYSWPVQYDFTAQQELSSQFGAKGYLVYYFSFFLPSAIVGKFLGWKIANIFLFIWVWLGLNLFVFWLFRYLKKSNLLILLFFIFFSGMDVLVSQHLISGEINSPAFLSSVLNPIPIDNWAVGYFQYSSITTQLFYVFNQSLPAWIITIWLFNQNNRKIILFIYSLLIFFAPFPFIGLSPFFIYKFFIIPLSEKKQYYFHILFLKKLQESISFQNIIGACSLLFVAGIFFKANVG